VLGRFLDEKVVAEHAFDHRPMLALVATVCAASIHPHCHPRPANRFSVTAVMLSSTIACPFRGFEKSESMPENAWFTGTSA
jgi:hypothetical protein